MAKESKIAWTDSTFNAWWGCQRVSPACDHCYAEELDARYYSKSGDAHWGDVPRKIMSDKYWREPLKWERDAAKENRRQLVFCSSMADVFETNDTVDDQRSRLWKLIYETPHLRWLLLTKRPQNIKRMLPKGLWGFPTLWLGTTIESPAYLWRADAVCEVPAAVHFLSMEPLVERTPIADKLRELKETGIGIDWLIDGCESGDKSRPTPIDWYREHRDACAALGIHYFFKQAPQVAAGVTSGPGSWLKFNRSTAHPDTGAIVRGIVEQPYLDGVQHVSFPG